ncbi:MAG: hypothetical protein R3C26_00860 [Calditrichia bacterium]
MKHANIDAADSDKYLSIIQGKEWNRETVPLDAAFIYQFERKKATAMNRWLR